VGGGRRAAIVTVVLVLAGCAGTGRERTTAAVTFADVAPIFHRSCAGCHRPDGIAPFALLSYADARGRATDIVDAVRSRFMPPWLPEPGHARLRGERRLSDDEIARIRAWVAAGTRQGDPSHAPRPREVPSGWQLGVPDLIVRLPEPYALTPRGGEVFRNFVLPVAITGRRWVRAVEFLPRSRGRIHHAVLFTDTTGEARRLDALDRAPGYAGMEGGAAPDGHFVGWSPGREPRALADGLAWEIREGMDLVLQLHLMPGDVPTTVQPEIGLYFAPGPPRALPVVLNLGSKTIDIPAGAPAHTVRDAYVLGTDVDALTIFPHAHYLCREITVEAALPDGQIRPLLEIRRWNFDWQDEYQFEEPVWLPAGTTIRMAMTYDNSAENRRNPNRPPRRVVWGSRSADEMADVWLTVVPRDPSARARLIEEQARRDLERLAAGYAFRLTVDPEDVEAHSRLGHILVGEGRASAALPHLEAARRRRPGAWGVLHNLGVAHAALGRYPDAVRSFRAALELNPSYAATHRDLATTLALLGQFEDAIAHYDRTLALRPDDADAHNNVAVLLARLGRPDAAEAHYRQALRVRPDDVATRTNLAALLARLGRDEEAISEFVAALDARPSHDPALRGLADVVARGADRSGSAPAREHLRTALATAADDPVARRYTLGLALTELGRLDEATRQIEAVLRLRPNDPAATRALAAITARRRGP
jgi:tetratricopeptide (TPR) repeat protein/mono/diheme cytochrome c family protein